MQRCLEILLALAPDQIRQVGDQARRYILEHRQWRNNALQLAGLFRQIEADRKRS
jgi:hypothetical protein